MQPGSTRAAGWFRYGFSAVEGLAHLRQTASWGAATPAAASHPPHCCSHPAVACFSSMARTGASAALLAAASRLEAALPGAARAFRSSTSQLADITVAVPSMGESITEGTVAAILKQPGVQSCGCGRQLAGVAVAAACCARLPQSNQRSSSLPCQSLQAA